jgi:hypothetical protein
VNVIKSALPAALGKSRGRRKGGRRKKAAISATGETRVGNSNQFDAFRREQQTLIYSSSTNKDLPNYIASQPLEHRRKQTRSRRSKTT